MYDHFVPKSFEGKENYPIWDYWPKATKYRPDFVLHLYSEDYEEAVILDAKFKTSKKCFEDLNSFKPRESILVKYGTKLFLSGDNHAPPRYVGALCCVQDEKATHDWFIRNEDTAHPLQSESGVTVVDANNLSPIIDLLNGLWLGFKARANKKPGHIVSSISPVELDEQTPNNLARRYIKSGKQQTIKRTVNTNARFLKPSDKAPSLTEEDAKIIKGMLRRGDIPQHITQYFGVNPGRISDIKSGKTFENTTPKDEEELPLSGPYPPIKELLEKFPEIEQIFAKHQKSDLN